MKSLRLIESSNLLLDRFRHQTGIMKFTVSVDIEIGIDERQPFVSSLVEVALIPQQFINNDHAQFQFGTQIYSERQGELWEMRVSCELRVDNTFLPFLIMIMERYCIKLDCARIIFLVVFIKKGFQCRIHQVHVSEIQIN